jgi:ribonuclease J
VTPGEELLFLALGGSGEIGMNVNLYGCRGKWLMADLGLTFADPDYPGIDLILPDLEFIEQRMDDLVGIVLTHGHEDHIGALPYLAADLKVPLYATPFTAGLIAGKLEEEGLTGQVILRVIERGGSIDLDPFRVTYVPLAHSIPEGNGLLIETPFGNVFHTGDWKIDETPVLGTQFGRNAERKSATRRAGTGVRFHQRLPERCVGQRILGHEALRNEVTKARGARARSPPSRRMPRGWRRLAGWRSRPTARCRGRAQPRSHPQGAKATGYLLDFPETDRASTRR